MCGPCKLQAAAQNTHTNRAPRRDRRHRVSAFKERVNERTLRRLHAMRPDARSPSFSLSLSDSRCECFSCVVSRSLSFSLLNTENLSFSFAQLTAHLIRISIASSSLLDNSKASLALSFPRRLSIHLLKISHSFPNQINHN